MGTALMDAEMWISNNFHWSWNILLLTFSTNLKMWKVILSLHALQEKATGQFWPVSYSLLTPPPRPGLDTLSSGTLSIPRGVLNTHKIKSQHLSLTYRAFCCLTQISSPTTMLRPLPSRSVWFFIIPEYTMDRRAPSWSPNPTSPCEMRRWSSERRQNPLPAPPPLRVKPGTQLGRSVFNAPLLNVHFLSSRVDI